MKERESDARRRGGDAAQSFRAGSRTAHRSHQRGHYSETQRAGVNAITLPGCIPVSEEVRVFRGARRVSEGPDHPRSRVGLRKNTGPTNHTVMNGRRISLSGGRAPARLDLSGTEAIANPSRAAVFILGEARAAAAIPVYL